MAADRPQLAPLLPRWLAMQRAVRDATLHRVDLAVLAIMLDHSSGRCTTSAATVAVAAGCSERGVIRARQKLIEGGYLVEEQRRGRTSIFMLNPATPDTGVTPELCVTPAAQCTPDTGVSAGDSDPCHPCHPTPDTGVTPPLTPMSPEPVLREPVPIEPIEQDQKLLLTADAAKPPKPKKRAAASESDPDGFANFWTPYPRKVSKPLALKAWAKLKPAERELAIADVEARNAGFGWSPDAQFIPHPATYLNGQRWSDDWRTTSTMRTATANGARPLPSFDSTAAAENNARAAQRIGSRPGSIGTQFTMPSPTDEGIKGSPELMARLAAAGLGPGNAHDHGRGNPASISTPISTDPASFTGAVVEGPQGLMDYLAEREQADYERRVQEAKAAGIPVGSPRWLIAPASQFTDRVPDSLKSGPTEAELQDYERRVREAKARGLRPGQIGYPPPMRHEYKAGATPYDPSIPGSF